MSLSDPIDRSSPNSDARPEGRAIDMLVLHYTGMESASAALARLCDPGAKVSAHYMIDEDGTVYRLVAEERRAWHAGISAWEGERNVNDRSIGIELVNPGHEFGYRPFPEPQMAVLTRLARAILFRHTIQPWRVLGHSDVAPIRKQDPGELFPWARLAEAGIGLWVDYCAEGETPPVKVVQALLAEYGYDCPETGIADEPTRLVVTAFQRHFRPERVDGLIDLETAVRIAALVDRKRRMQARLPTG
ncbi:MAG TPA: N-acetylmuramoyl-L-alanine amidase [Alphaproteobacteria bacterium]|nr:N-acetylmuramoyl-L-alanine amidase [Alphaproteobacteria bacterium]